MKLTAMQNMRLFENHRDLVISKKQAICKGCLKMGTSVLAWRPSTG